MAKLGNKTLWPKGVPDVRWRAHVAVWAAKQALSLEGDFVECGVFGGLLSLTICEYFKFREAGPTFWLFDTFTGLPVEQLPESEKQAAIKQNRFYTSDCFELARKNFAPYPNIRIIRGALPGTLSEPKQLKKIAYLSMDLNNASAERSTIHALWDKIVPGAVIVLDDYGFASHTTQYEMWNDFAKSKGRMVLTLPTGQGLLIK